MSAYSEDEFIAFLESIANEDVKFYYGVYNHAGRVIDSGAVNTFATACERVEKMFQKYGSRQCDVGIVQHPDTDAGMLYNGTEWKAEPEV